MKRKSTTKSSIVLLALAGLAVSFDAYSVITGGSAMFTTETVMCVCASHICRVIEDK